MQLLLNKCPILSSVSGWRGDQTWEACLKPALIITGGEPRFRRFVSCCNPDAVSVSSALTDLTASLTSRRWTGSTCSLSAATCGADYEGPSVYGGPRCRVFNMARAERRVLTARGSARPTLRLSGR